MIQNRRGWQRTHALNVATMVIGCAAAVIKKGVAQSIGGSSHGEQTTEVLSHAFVCVDPERPDKFQLTINSCAGENCLARPIPPVFKIIRQILNALAKSQCPSGPLFASSLTP